MIFLGGPVIGTFKKLSYERKLALYFSLLTSFFVKGTLTTPVLSACQMFAKCADDPQVLELLQKCFVRIKTAISHENRLKN